MQPVRMIYVKEGRVRYLSHLDQNRVFQRAVMRSRLPLWVTEGFHPHVYLNFLRPIGLGIESEYELCDFKLPEGFDLGEARERLNEQLPEGFFVREVYLPEQKAAEIGYKDVSITLTPESGTTDHLSEAVDAFLAQPSILVEKKGKKNTVTVDLRQVVELLEKTAREHSLNCLLRLPAAQEGAVSPLLWAEACRTFLQRPVRFLCRLTVVRNQQKAVFR